MHIFVVFVMCDTSTVDQFTIKRVSVQTRQNRIFSVISRTHISERRVKRDCSRQIDMFFVTYLSLIHIMDN
jgi:hypothetical protein